MDGVGIRPAMLAIGERLASHGYYVLLPDLFYRAGPYEPMDPKEVFTNPDKRKQRAQLRPRAHVWARSAHAWVDSLHELPRIDGQP
jgi:dienelactone hydrolase